MARIEVINIDAWLRDFLGRNGYRHKILYDDGTEDVWRLALTVAPATPALSPAFYKEEWAQVIQPQGITDMAAYLTAPRLGRGTAISRKERAAIWTVFEEYRTLLNEKSSKEFDDAVRDARILLEGKGDVLPYRCVIVDEAQDMADEVFRLIRQIVPASESGKNDLFIVGDGHQQIYRRSVTLGRCGINIRGRSRKLRINYRTTDETCRWATALLIGVPVADLDNGADDQRGYRSLMHGDDPQLRHFADFDAEVAGIAEHLKSLGDQRAADTCLVLRTQALLERYEAVLKDNGVAVYRISRNSPDDRREPGVRLATMHRVKGLQFEHMIVAAANADILPLALQLQR
jgi:superfamily I DNA/RNA helicase